MPRVPSYDGGQVHPNVQPNFQQSDYGANPSDFGAGTGRALQQFGRVATVIAGQEREKADSTALLDAQAKMSEAENHFHDPNNPDGLYAHKGIDALKAGDQLLPEYDRIAGEIEAKLPSERARVAFRSQTQQRRASFAGQINDYGVREKEQYEAQSYDAFAQTVARDLTRAVATGDPSAATYEANLVGGINAYAIAQGWPAQKRELATEKAVSSAYRQVIESTVATDPTAAQAQFDRFGPKLTFEDASDLSAKMKPLVDETIGRSFVDRTVAGGVQPPGQVAATSSDQLADQLLPCIQRLETGGLGAKASTAVSSAGAVGTFQLKPDTARAAAQRLGIAFQPDDLKDPTKNQALAREELRFLCTKFNNDADAVLAAYNMGAGAAAGWAAGKPYQTQSGATWTPRFPKDPDAMPAETRSYVRQGLAGGPAPERGRVIEAINTAPGLSETQRSHARTYYNQMLAAQNAERQDNDRATMESVYTKVWDARDSGKSLRDVLTPDEFTYVVANNHAEALTNTLTPAKSPNTTSLDQAGLINQQFYYAAGNGTPQLQAEARAFIAEFNPYDVTKWHLTNEQRKEFGTQRGALAAHNPKAVAELKATGQLIDNTMFNTFGYTEHPSGTDADEHFNQFQAQLTEAIQKFKADPRNKGEMPTQEQVQRMADVLTLQTASGKRYFETDGGSIEVPAEDARLIREAHPNYTDDQVRRLYLLAKTQRAK